MTIAIAATIALFLAYLFGSIPVGYLVARLWGVDVTASGSGRTGGTNVLRAAGPLAAGLTVMGDVFKGLIPVYVIQFFAPAFFPVWISALAMPAAVLGHNHSIFLKFRGGVGAGTAIGTLGGVHFVSGVITAALALVALAISRYASILSTTVAVSGVLLFTIFAFLGQISFGYILGAVLNLLLMVYALRPNYARLRAGTERRVGQPKEKSSPTA